MLERPWARIPDPTPIPEDVDAELLDEMDDQAFAELLRDNLLPRVTEVQRRDWERLWEVLREDEDLTERAFDVLEDFLDALQDLRHSGRADEAELKRGRKFESAVKSGWGRLERTEAMTAEKRVRRLIGAITRHREKTLGQGWEPTSADRDLWKMLGRLGVDPERQPKN